MTEEEKKAADDAAALVAAEEAKKTAPPAEEFAKDDVVSKNKYNQTLRKLREKELEVIELATKVKTVAPIMPTPAPAVAAPLPPAPKKDVWDDEEEEEKKPIVQQPSYDEEKISRLVEEKIKPIYDAQKNAFETQKKTDRDIFFEKNPQYLTDSVAWQELIEEMNRSINPHSGDTYLEQLEKARKLVEYDKATNVNVENFKKDIANDAANVNTNGGNKAPANQDAITPEERALMKEYGISEEGMRAYKNKVKNGDITVMGLN